MRKFHLLITAVILTSLVIGATGCANQGQKAEAINLPMGYVASVQFSPYYLAKSRGYFAEAGYDVSFDYRWETDGIQLVAAGEIPFTVASGDQVIQARAQGLPVVAVASWWHGFPVAVMALSSTPLNSPADLEGLSIGIPETFGASYIGLRALLAEAGLTEEDIDLQVIGYTQVAALTSGTVDAVVVYVNNEPILMALEGINPELLLVSDYVDMVANGIVTSEAMIENNPEQVTNFVGAFLAGVTDAVRDPAAAFEVSLNYVEGLSDNVEVQRAVLDASVKFWDTDTPGAFDVAQWEKAQNVMLEAGLIEQPTDVNAMYTNEFLP